MSPSSQTGKARSSLSSPVRPLHRQQDPRAPCCSPLRMSRIRYVRVCISTPFTTSPRLLPDNSPCHWYSTAFCKPYRNWSVLHVALSCCSTTPSQVEQPNRKARQTWQNTRP